MSIFKVEIRKEKEFKNLNLIHEQDVCKDDLSIVILLYMGMILYCHLVNLRSRDHGPSSKEWKGGLVKTNEEEVQLHDIAWN